ncbi:ABC-three component system middle component 2 [Rhizobium nepotum]|uniref:ABC-three component system middle component 2 n=1 Tax=Rhizobium nepotum TaxID=1035271 RepID=UPI003CF15AB8
MCLDYAQALRKRSQWLVTQFGEMSDGDLADFMNANVGRWGAEFERFTATRDLEL